jgi:lysophospholipase
MPRPWHLIAHSMGGAIGLRALHEGLGVRAAVFSAPMWGIQLTRIMRPIAWGMGWIHHGIGRSGRPAMRRSEQLYVLDTAFEENFLTRDKEMFRYMRAQIQAHPELGIGGPSMGWAYAALRECRALARLPSPAIPALCYLGTQEKIVDPLAIRQRMARWKNGVLHELEGAEHEIMMEEEAVRTRFFDQVAAHFRTHA